jgi:uncharacterized protein YbcI
VSDSREHPTQADSTDLTGPDWSDGVETKSGSSVTAEVSNAMVGLKKKFYGRGPTRAKTYVNDNYIFCVLDGGLTQNERTLLDAGEQQLVRSYRLRFEEVMAEQTTEAVERITGCKVLGYHSQIIFDPTVAIEMFILDGEPSESHLDKPGRPDVP